MLFFQKKGKEAKSNQILPFATNKILKTRDSSWFISDILEGVKKNKKVGLVATGTMILLSAGIGACSLVNGWVMSMLQSTIDSKVLAFGVLNGVIASMPGIFEVVINFSYGIGEKISGVFRSRVADFVKVRNMGRILDLPALTRQSKGNKVLEGASASITEASNNYLSFMMGLGGSSVMFLSALGVLACVSLSNAAIVLGLTACKLGVSKFIEGKIVYRQKELEELRAASVAMISDFSKNGEMINAVSSQRKIEIHNEAIRKTNECHKKRVDLEKSREKWNTINLGMDLISVVGFSLMGLYNFDLVRDIGLYTITVGSSARGMMAGSRVVRDVQGVMASLGQGAAAEKILYDNGKCNVRVGEKGLSKAQGHICIKGLDFSYIQDAEGQMKAQRVLSNFDFEVIPGEKIAIIGKSGSGKSTVLSIVSRKFEFQEGMYQIDGQDVRDLEADAVAKNISSMINEAQFFETQDIRYNLRHYKKDVTDEEIMDVFKKVKLDGVLASEKGLESKPDELSMGQKQRLRLAGTLLYDAPIVILDEITSNLDPETKSDILANLDELFDGKTVLMATHSPEEVAMADRVIIMDEGKIIEQGKALDLFQNKESYFYQLFGKYQSVFEWEEKRKKKTAQQELQNENEKTISKFLALDVAGQSMANSAFNSRLIVKQPVSSRRLIQSYQNEG